MATAAPDVTWCAVAGVIGFVWGLSEIIGAFKNETSRALRTGGAWLLVWLNCGAAAGIFLLVASVIPDANNWLMAVFVGFAWPTVIPTPASNSPSLCNLNRRAKRPWYASSRPTGPCKTWHANSSTTQLTRQRMKLVTTAIQCDLPALERYARLAQIASPLQEDTGTSQDSYIDRIMQRQMEDDLKKAYLAAFILTHFGRDTLHDFHRTQRQQRET